MSVCFCRQKDFRILKIPVDGDSLILPDDSIALDTLGLILCRGIRNTYDFAYNGTGDLFGAENSGDRDADDELNWIQSGHHYGFPWVMGDSYNPQQFAGFDSSADVMINHASTSYVQGFFTNDPAFPQQPGGLTLTKPCLNYGPDGDRFRDSTNGMIMDASDLAIADGNSAVGIFSSNKCAPSASVTIRISVRQRQHP